MSQDDSSPGQESSANNNSTQEQKSSGVLDANTTSPSGGEKSSSGEKQKLSESALDKKAVPQDNDTATETASETKDAEAQSPRNSDQPHGEPTKKPQQPQKASATANKSNDSKQKDEDIQVSKWQQEQRTLNRDYIHLMRLYAPEQFANVAIPQMHVGGDVYINATTSGEGVGVPEPPERRDAAEVPEFELLKIKAVYCHHAEYGNALEVLRRRRLIVLKGNLHVGKRAAALRMAMEVSQANEKTIVRELAPAGKLDEQLAVQQHKPVSIYLVDGMLASVGEKLDRLSVNRIFKTLEKHNCYLIICASPSVPVPSTFPVVSLSPLQGQSNDVLFGHLSYYGHLSDEQIEQVLQDASIQELLDSQVNYPAQIDRLAQRLDTVLQTPGKTIQDALNQFDVTATKEVAAWFDQTADDIEESAFKIALAVFHGTYYENVNQAAENLADHLRKMFKLPKKKKKAKKKRLSPFVQQKRSRRLEAARAKMVKRETSTEYSKSALVEVVELQDEVFSPALLNYIWQEFNDIRPVLLGWLDRYATGPYPSDIRMRASVAVGALSRFDFPYIQHMILNYWAKGDEDNNHRRRMYQALGNALGVVIWDDSHAEDVLGLLRFWSESSDERLRWAAARAYAQIGLRYPLEAINQWRAIVESAGRIAIGLTPNLRISLPHPLGMSVVDAVISLFSRAVEFPHRLRPVFEQSLEGIAAWVAQDAKDRDSEEVGLPLFLIMAQIQTFPEEIGDQNENEWMPAVLYCVGTQPESIYRRMLADLIRRALRDKNWRSSMIEILHQWVECADNNVWIEETLEALLAELLRLPATSRRERNLLAMYLGRWARHPQKPIAAADRLVTKLHLTTSYQTHSSRYLT